jgi:transmembrane sensor
MTADSSSGNVRQAGAPDWDAIARFLAGESTPAEAAIVRAWLDANPRERDLLERLDAVAARDALAPMDVDVESALARVHERMGRINDAPALTVVRGGASRGVQGVQGVQGVHASRTTKYALVGTIAAAAVFTAVMLNQQASRPDGGARTYSTATGQRDSVLLADGSRVTLGPRSTLVVPADYAEHRTVQLSGDAFFDVTHDASKPFGVRVKSAFIQDVGTSFAVESDALDATSVAVVSGSVRLRSAGTPATEGVVLSAGDRGDIDANGHTRVARQVVSSDDVAWTAGKLVFRDAPLSQVAAELQRWYGVTLQADDSILYQRHVTTEFNGDSIDQVLRILQLAIDARIDRHGDTATLHSTRGASGSR